MKNYKFIINGKVQGVYYRANVKKNALKSSYNGYVKNLPDGSVEACVSCDESRLDDFIAILQKGSLFSKVISIEQKTSTQTLTNSFEVR